MTTILCADLRMLICHRPPYGLRSKKLAGAEPEEVKPELGGQIFEKIFFSDECMSGGTTI